MKTYSPPPDKSITLRALLLGAIADGRTVIKNPLFCGDTTAAINCLRTLGVVLRVAKDRIIVAGLGLRGLKPPQRALNAGEAGAVSRMLAGLLSGQTFPSAITGAAQLRRRPMRRVTEPLTLMGARIRTRSGRLPMVLTPAVLNGIEYLMPVASAQVKSALLFAGLYATGPTAITEPSPSRDHTERLLRYFGARLSRNGKTAIVKPGSLKGRALPVPGDISSAAPFIAAALLSGRKLLIKNTGLNPTRLGLIRTLKKMGAGIKLKLKQSSPEPAGDLLVTPAKLRGVIVKGTDVPAMIDEIPLLALIAAAADGKTKIQGAGELRHKESDRVKGTLALLKSLGARAAYRRGTLEIYGAQPWTGAEITSRNDHRIAMAAAVAGLRASGPVRITDPDCVKKSYPGFFRDFKKIFSPR